MRRPRPAASARVLTAGLSTAATFGIMTAMAAGAGGSGDTTGTPEPVPEAEAPRTVVIIRRHLVQVPSGAATPPPVSQPATSAPAAATPAQPATRPASPAAGPPAVRPAPVARTRAS